MNFSIEAIDTFSQELHCFVSNDVFAYRDETKKNARKFHSVQISFTYFQCVCIYQWKCSIAPPLLLVSWIFWMNCHDWLSVATYFCRIGKFTLIHKIELKLFLLQKPRLIRENPFKVSCLKAIETYIDKNIPKWSCWLLVLSHWRWHLT